MNAAVSDRITLVRHANDEDWTDAVAKEMANVLAQEIQQHGRARMLLSGGTTPAPIYEVLAEQPLEWARVEVGLADERWLSPQDKDSNAWLVRNSFLAHAEGAHFDPLVRVGRPIAECVHTANLMAQHSQPACLVVLGMGNDGHTASLFPGSRDLERALQSNQPYAALDATGCPVANTWPLRITLTPHGLATAGNRLLLLRGKQKLEVLEAALASNDVHRYPVLAAINAPGNPLRVHWVP
ncbi:6-phosphogluconolactonase [Stenotrophomonas sp. SY1]|uniref:6-phosphogluconolactonase n=1 Tax=Stenotrophomonas sp. SY1 TaxID=477235 RepID=UPI001E4B70E9|nr:6-phosphogluconolactonase [Stenotrophomonas sp. SY1]MCD9086794.1 6-phosphogluconolactonase [Stenotrophomonas sp. SY1]